MRKLAVVLVALMIVLAGCSGGGNGGGETDADETETPEVTADTTTDDPGDGMDGSDEGSDDSDADDSGDGGDGMDGSDGDSDSSDGDDSDSSDSDGSDDSDSDQGTSDIELSQALNTSAQGPFSGSVELDMTLINGSREQQFVWRNDTQRQLIRLDTGGATDTYYLSDQGAAYRNSSTGETRYGGPDGMLATEAGFSAFIALAGFSYVGILEWDRTGTTTVNGQQAVTFESDSVNRTAIDENDFSVDGDIESATGEMTVTENGIQSASVRITGGGMEAGVDLTITRGDVTVEAPDWVDESQLGA